MFTGVYYDVIWTGSQWFITRGNPETVLASIQYSIDDGINFTNITSGGFSAGCYTIAYNTVTVPATTAQTLITSSNLIVNNLPAIPYAGYGTVTSSGPILVTLPYTYSNLPSIVVGHYNTGSYRPTVVYLSSITTSNFTVNASVYNSASLTWGTPSTVQFTWIATANTTAVTS
jgi:hypothetical protein